MKAIEKRKNHRFIRIGSLGTIDWLKAFSENQNPNDSLAVFSKLNTLAFRAYERILEYL